MPNETLNIFVKLKDQISQSLQGIQGKLQGFATSFKQNWIAISVAITGAVLALRKAFELLEMGAQAKQLEESFKRMATAVGEDADKMKKAIQDVSAETTNFSNIAGNVSALLAQGLNMRQVTDLMKQARVEAKLFGKTTEESFGVMTSAITGGLVTTLRRTYGLQLSLKTAVEDYAKANKLSTSAVQEFYLAQALTNHILEKSKGHLLAVNLELKTEYEYLQEVKSRWNDFLESVGQIMWKMLGGLQALFATIQTGISQVIVFIIQQLQTVVNWILKVVEAGERIPKIGEAFKGIGNNLRDLSSGLKSQAELWKTATQDFALTATNQWDGLFNSVQTDTQETTKVLQDAFKVMREENKKNAELMKDDVKTEMDIMKELGKNTAINIQNSFSDFFFKSFTGEITSAKEAFAEFGRAMLQTISQIIAQLIVVAMFKKIGLGSLIGFQTGTPFVPRTGIYMLHKGERVTPAHENNGQGNNNGGGVTVEVNQIIQAWDAYDVWRNRKVLSEAIASEIRNNAGIRGTIMQLT